MCPWTCSALRLKGNVFFPFWKHELYPINCPADFFRLSGLKCCLWQPYHTSRFYKELCCMLSTWLLMYLDALKTGVHCQRAWHNSRPFVGSNGGANCPFEPGHLPIELSRQNTTHCAGHQNSGLCVRRKIGHSKPVPLAMEHHVRGVIT